MKILVITTDLSVEECLDDKELAIFKGCLHFQTSLTLHIGQSMVLEAINLLIRTVTLITGTWISF